MQGNSAASAGPYNSARQGGLAIFNQAIISATSFLTTVILGRSDQSELGVFYLMMSVIIFARNVQTRLISAPYAVFFSGHRHSGASYAGSSFFFQSCFSLLAVAALLLVLGVGKPHPQYAALTLALAFAVPLLLAQDFVRHFAFAHQQVKLMIASDALIMALQICGLLWVFHLSSLSARSAYAVISVACVAGLAVWVARNRQPVILHWHRLGKDFRQNWAFARWALASKLIGESSPFIIPWILTLQLGAKAAGAYAACLAVAGVTNVFTGGIGRYMNANAPRIFIEQGARALNRFLLRFAAFFVLCLGVFAAFMFLLGDRLLAMIFGAEFADFGLIAALLAAYGLANSLGMTAGAGIWALNRPRANLPADVLCTVTTLGLALLLVAGYGLLGVALAVLIGMLLGAIARFISYRSLLGDLNTQVAKGDPS